MDNRELENRALYYKAVTDYRQRSESKHEEGFMFLKEAADRGYAEAEKLMGVLYMSGQYAPYPEKNMDIAILCYEAAAEDGDVEAMYWLSQCYEMGMGVEKDADMADKWRIRAIANGFVPASDQEDEEPKKQGDEFKPKKVAPPRELSEEEADREQAVEEEARKLKDKVPAADQAEETDNNETAEENGALTEEDGAQAEEGSPAEDKISREEGEMNDAQAERELEMIRRFRQKIDEKRAKDNWQMPLRYGVIFGVIAILAWLVLIMIIYLAARSLIGEDARTGIVIMTVVVSLAALTAGALLGVKEGNRQAAEAGEYEVSAFYESFRFALPLESDQEWLYKTYKTLSKVYEPVVIGQKYDGDRSDRRESDRDKNGSLLPGWFFRTDRGSTRPEFVVLTGKAMYVIRAMQVKGRLAGTLKDLDWTLRIDSEVKRGLDALKSGGPVSLITGKETPAAVEKLLNMVDENAFGMELIKEELSQKSGLDLSGLPVYNVLLFGPSLDIREVRLSGAPSSVIAMQGDAGKLILQMERIESRLPFFETDLAKLRKALETVGRKQLSRLDQWEQNQKQEMEELSSQTVH